VWSNRSTKKALDCSAFDRRGHMCLTRGSHSAGLRGGRARADRISVAEFRVQGEKSRGLAAREVDIRLPGKENSSSHGARPVRQIISMIKWTRVSRLSIKNCLSRVDG